MSPQMLMQTRCLGHSLLEETENIDASQLNPSTSMQEEILGLQQELEGAGKRIGVFESQLFCYKNLSDLQAREYTNIDRKAFRALVILIDCFQPLNYWFCSDVAIDFMACFEPVFGLMIKEFGRLVLDIPLLFT